MKRKFTPGMRVRAKIRTMGGWKGIGTVIDSAGGVVEVRKDHLGLTETACFTDDELVILRDQTPMGEARMTIRSNMTLEELEGQRRALADHMFDTCRGLDGLTHQHCMDAAETVPDGVIILADDEYVGGFLILYLGQYIYFSLKGGHDRGWTTQ